MEGIHTKYHVLALHRPDDIESFPPRIGVRTPSLVRELFANSTLLDSGRMSAHHVLIGNEDSWTLVLDQVCELCQIASNNLARTLLCSIGIKRVGDIRKISWDLEEGSAQDLHEL